MVTAMAITDPTDARTDVASASQVSRRKLLVMVLALLCAVASVLFWQWRSVGVFDVQGNEVSWDLEVGETGLVGLTWPGQDISPSVLTVHSVEPQMTEGNLPVEALVCHRWSNGDVIGTVPGNEIDQYCKTYPAAVEAQMGANDQLILRVSSDEPGSAVIEGIKVTYSHGWRRGSQVTGPTVILHVGDGTVRDEAPTD